MEKRTADLFCMEKNENDVFGKVNLTPEQVRLMELLVMKDILSWRIATFREYNP